MYQHQIFCSSLYKMKEQCCSQWTHSCVLLRALWMRTPIGPHGQNVTYGLGGKTNKQEQWTLLLCLKYFITRKTKSVPFSLNEVTEYVPEIFQNHVDRAEPATSWVTWEPQLPPRKADELSITRPPGQPTWALLSHQSCSNLVFAGQQLRQPSFGISALKYILYGKTYWYSKIIQRQMNNIYFRI